jgi:glycosyltransferase involved in cell wall biosynthesis
VRKLVSVITGTHQRHDLLVGAIENVREQTYPSLEHVIVSDGPDPELRRKLNDYDWLGDRNLRIDELLEPIAAVRQRYIPTLFAECGRHWSRFLAYSISAVPFQVAQWMARGDYLIWLADDERMTPEHIESLVDLLEATDSDFVYSRCECWFAPGVRDDLGPMIVGTDPPRCGTVTNVLYRAELLDYAGFEPHVGSGTDWHQVEAWMAAGARWAMLGRVTFRHRVDKMGEGPNVRMERQPLRGHRQ